MLKLIIGNKAYSSWSLRGWLACKLSGLPFEEVVVPLYDQDWNQRREGDEFAPSSGKVPILWDGDAVVWDSLAIVEYLNEKSGGDKFWPTDPAARHERLQGATVAHALAELVAEQQVAERGDSVDDLVHQNHAQDHLDHPHKDHLR